MRQRAATVALILLATASAARGQFAECKNLDRINARLAGRVVDFTHNHGADRRIVSPILGMPRDLYVYLPPGYDPRLAYPLILYFHPGYTDAHAFLAFDQLDAIDSMIRRGQIPPVIVAAPDGTYRGENRFSADHSMFVDGVRYRFEDHVMREVLPFVTTRFSVRPEREAHGVIGASAGGFGAMSLALKRRDVFGAAATLAGPLNLRYYTIQGRYRDDFDPATYRPRSAYNPNEAVGVFYFGLNRVRARRFIGPVFGEDAFVSERIRRENPADLLSSTDLKPGELAMYVNYPGEDEWNFDAQAESFLWLAALRGIAADAECDPGAGHSIRYFTRNHPKAYYWMGQHLLPPAPAGVTASRPPRR